MKERGYDVCAWVLHRVLLREKKKACEEIMRWALTSPTLFTSSILVTVHLVPIPSHVCRTHIPHVAWHVSRMWCANTRTRGTTPLGSASAKHRSLQASAHTAYHGRQVIKLLSYLTVARNIYYPSSGSTPPFFSPLFFLRTIPDDSIAACEQKVTPSQ